MKSISPIITNKTYAEGDTQELGVCDFFTFTFNNDYNYNSSLRRTDDFFADIISLNEAALCYLKILTHQQLPSNLV
jgi:hypothetical protein